MLRVREQALNVLNISQVQVCAKLGRRRSRYLLGTIRKRSLGGKPAEMEHARSNNSLLANQPSKPLEQPSATHSPQLLFRTALNIDIGLLILSEHNRSPCNYPSWASSSDGKCSIALTTIAGIGAKESGSGPGFAWLRLGNVRAFSCYWTPNGDSAADRLEAFKGFLDGLDQAIRQVEKENETLLVAGNFNAKSTYWGSSVDDSKGEALESFAASLGL